MALRDTHDRIPTFAEFLALIDDRVPLVAELKSDWSGDRRLEARVATILPSTGPGGGDVLRPNSDASNEASRASPAARPDRRRLRRRTRLGSPFAPSAALASAISWRPPIPVQPSSPMGSTTCRRRRRFFSARLGVALISWTPHAGGLGKGAPLYRPDHVFFFIVGFIHRIAGEDLQGPLHRRPQRRSYLRDTSSRRRCKSPKTRSWRFTGASARAIPPRSRRRRRCSTTCSSTRSATTSRRSAASS